MPWCDECSKFWSPSSLPASGACPTCGRTLAPGAITTKARRADEVTGVEPEADEYKAPWHFKLMVALAAIYLTWRFIQLISWVI
jgi:hypothetical protein